MGDLEEYGIDNDVELSADLSYAIVRLAEECFYSDQDELGYWRKKYNILNVRKLIEKEIRLTTESTK